jgi:hypothetical protein
LTIPELQPSIRFAAYHLLHRFACRQRHLVLCLDYPKLISGSFAKPANGSPQAVFVGLDVVVPLIEGDLLKIPKLCRLYFQLLGYMLEAFPERMAALSGATVNPVPVWTLTTGFAPCPVTDDDLASPRR